MIKLDFRFSIDEKRLYELFVKRMNKINIRFFLIIFVSSYCNRYLNMFFFSNVQNKVVHAICLSSLYLFNIPLTLLIFVD
jgi:hypothetical protein